MQYTGSFISTVLQAAHEEIYELHLVNSSAAQAAQVQQRLAVQQTGALHAALASCRQQFGVELAARDAALDEAVRQEMAIAKRAQEAAQLQLAKVLFLGVASHGLDLMH